MHIGAKQKGLDESAAGAHASFEERANQGSVTLHPNYPATSHSRLLTEIAQASHITPPTTTLTRSSSAWTWAKEVSLRLAHEVFVNPLALPPAFVLPAMDGAFVEAEGRNYCLKRAAVC